LIFAGYTGSKNQVQTQQKIKFVSKSIFQKLSGDRLYCFIFPGGHLQAEIGNDRTASAALESGQSFTCHFPSSGHFLHYHFGRTSGPK
jgi:hypothetical protein